MLLKTTVVNLRKDSYDIYIGRGNKWGNPFKMKDSSDKERKQVIDSYREYLLESPRLLESLSELKGKRLGCYCKPKPCHGDILVELIEKETKNGSIN